MSLEKKLEILFDPTQIQPILFDDENLKVIVEKIRDFDLKLDAMRHSLDGEITTSVWRSLFGPMKHSTRMDLFQTISQSLPVDAWGMMHESIRSSMLSSVKNTVWDSLLGMIKIPLFDSIDDSIRDSAWSSICTRFTKEEYEELFKDKTILETFPYEKVIELCTLYEWFSKQGIFVHRSLKKGDYLVASWKNSGQIHTVNILR